MEWIKRLVFGLSIIVLATACSSARETDRADLSKAEHKPMRDRYSDQTRDNTPGHQNRDVRLNHTQ